MKIQRKFPNKLNIIFIVILFISSSCKVEHNPIVGVWKPVTLILPESIKKTQKGADLVYMTFEQSKDIYYHFHPDSVFSLESPKDMTGFKDAIGTYSVKGNKISINIYNAVLKSDIIKLTNTEMHVQSTDSITIIYEKVKNE